MTGETDDLDWSDAPGEVPYTREALTSLVFFLAERWPNLSIDLDEDGEIVGVREAKPPRRREGRPTSSAKTFAPYLEAQRPAMAEAKAQARRLLVQDNARKFLKEDGARLRSGLAGLQDRADDAGSTLEAYSKRLTRARASCPGYPRRAGGQEQS